MIGDRRGQAHRTRHRVASGAGRRARGHPLWKLGSRSTRGDGEECGRAPLFRANLESVAEIERMFREVEGTLGRLDGLVNNAARFTRRDPLEITEADWDFIHAVNLKAVFFCCQNGARLMRKSGGGAHREHQLAGRLAALGGPRALLRVKGRRNHADARAGQGVRARDTVNSVAPGVIPFGELDAQAIGMIKATPALRGGTPDEIADAVAYFLSACNFITGQIMAVDGGLSQR